MPENFINVSSASTTGQIGSLPRRIVFATRETVSGFTPDAHSGLISVTAAQVAAVVAANPSSYAVAKFLATAFAGSVAPDFVYILCTGGGALTNAMLDKANYSPRSWSFLNVGSLTNGLSDASTYIADCVTASAWCTDAKAKIFFMSWSMIDGGTLPAALLLGGSLTTQKRSITVVTNAYDTIDEYTDCYHNPLLAALCAVLYGGSIARSIGSLSDAHDFNGVAGDTYSSTTRAYIAGQSLAQYNGAKDQGGSLFIYDTFMNSTQNPPTTMQLETQIAIDYINDYCVVSARNSLIAAGRTGVDGDYAGVLEVSALTRSALDTLWKAGAILSNADSSAAYTLVTLSATQIAALNPAWQAQGIIPVGSIVAQIAAYKAIHYFTIAFNFN